MSAVLGSSQKRGWCRKGLNLTDGLPGNESKPTCSNCRKTGERCQWGRPLSFLPQNAFTVDENSRSTRLSIGKPTEGHKKTARPVVEETETQGSTPHVTTNGSRSNGGGSHDGDRPSTEEVHENGCVGQHELEAFEPQSPVATGLENLPALYSAFHADVSPSPGLPIESPSLHDNLIDGATETQHVSLQGSATVPLGQFTPSGQSCSVLKGVDFEPRMGDDHGATLPREDVDFQLSPDMLTDDGIFLPGSRYQALHNTLRNHVFITARSAQPSREASPGFDRPGEHVHPRSFPSTFRFANSAGAEEISGTNIKLTPHQEFILWNNWVVEISAWLDKFDAREHFRHTLPIMAKTCSHLRFSMLALSARQLERKNGSLPASMSLALYQEAIHKLLPELNTKDVTVVASCVVLCVLEMLSCSPKAWRRHLDGCASLIRAMNIRGDSGGVEQALFWCFARMDVCGGLISNERTLIPIDEWMSNMSFESDCAAFRARTPDVFEEHATYSCYLVARVLHFLFGSPKIRDSPLEVYGKYQPNYADKWVELFDCLEAWYACRPPEMQALVSLNPGILHDGTSSPFPTVLFGNGAAVSGNQLHHTAALLMLQHIPKNVPKKSRSILWHARQICAISISNSHHGCWTNSVQPLWLAGQVMSHPAEHRAIVDIYERIEKETGWGATWRADDLKQHWGDLDE
ncbi:hypothetical protein A1O1_01766 [Capronia coronata CBS 617.96]|uniref:Zn(2)-C6 fungal-type domain-containing protein n=1 Tax=Capronia coronata CBS 617.96 TaxID=1182541 RepID=W9ZFW4_9EURO|nr:uncharacterized protein A1O1_01766 [Capronia coronata CBS 617.96]EXJ93374.1 hypothetical protein A1O1_01766 [Capronia coronata CBS 617.96]